MKSKINQPDRSDKFHLTIRKEEGLCIKHNLSPLQLAALKHNFQPFRYKINRRFVYISHYASKQLLADVKHNLSFLTNQLQKENACREVPDEYREAFEDPRLILSLPAHLRNKLCNLECYSMLRIMMLGRAYFESRKEFGPKSIKTIEELFTKYKCLHLFNRVKPG